MINYIVTIINKFLINFFMLLNAINNVNVFAYLFVNIIY